MLLLMGILDVFFNISIFRDIRFQDLIILFSVIILSKYIYQRSNYSSVNVLFIFLIFLVLISNILNFGFTGFTGGYLHYVRILFVMYFSYLLGLTIRKIPVSYNIFVKLIPIIPIIFFILQRIKFQLSDINAISSSDIYLLASVDETIGLFAWNASSAIASLYYVFIIYLNLNSRISKRTYLTSKFFLFLIIFLSVSRAAISGILITEIFVFYYYTTGAKKSLRIFFAILGFLLIMVFIDSFTNTGLFNIYNDKFSDFQNNLLETRLDKIFYQGFTNWYENYFFFGDGVSWGHSTLITVASKSGFFSLLLFIFFQFSVLKKGISSIDKFNIPIFILLFLIIFFQNFVADYHFTVPYYCFISYLFLGFLTPISHASSNSVK